MMVLPVCLVDFSLQASSYHMALSRRGKVLLASALPKERKRERERVPKPLSLGERGRERERERARERERERERARRERERDRGLASSGLPVVGFDTAANASSIPPTNSRPLRGCALKPGERRSERERERVTVAKGSGGASRRPHVAESIQASLYRHRILYAMSLGGCLMLVLHFPGPNQGIGWAFMPGDCDESPSPGERERERIVRASD